MLLQILFLVVCTIYNTQADLKVAVVEVTPLKGSNAQETIEKNINEARQLLNSAKGKNIDLFLLPEYALTGRTQDVANYARDIPDVLSTPDNSTYTILLLSNAAKEYDTYLAVNLLERVNRTNDPPTYHNTLVVFDKTGKIAHKYRKVNLASDESKLTAGTGSGLLTINGENVALLINEDLLTTEAFTLPQGVTSVVVAGRWRNTLPYNLATSVAAGFQLATNKTVYFSNLNDPVNGYSGSGVYFTNDWRRGVFITGKNQTSVKVYSPKAGRGLPGEDPLKGLNLRISNANVVESQSATNNTSLNKEVKCTVNHASLKNVGDQYNLAVLKSTEKIGSRSYKSTVCALLPKKEGRVDTDVIFDELRVHVTGFNRSALVYPLSADYTLLPFDNVTYARNEDVATLRGGNLYRPIVFGVRVLEETSAATSLASLGLWAVLGAALLARLNL